MKLQPPGFSLQQWFSYLTNVMTLSPIRKGSTEFPQGVLRLGGTFLLKDEDIVYAFEDPIPGQHADPAEVMRLAGAA